MLDHHSALIYTMVLASAAGSGVTDTELRTIGDIVTHLPIFAEYDNKQLTKTLSACSDLLQKENGLELALKEIKGVLPPRLRETAYALACDVLEGEAHDLGGVDDACFHQVHVLAGLGVEAVVGIGALEELADHDGAVGAGVLDDLARGHLDRLAHDVDADPLIVVGGPELGERFGRIEERDTTAADDALLDRRARRVHGVVNPT